MDAKYEAKLADLERRLLHQPRTLDPAIRQAAAAGTHVPEAASGYIDKVRRHAYRVTDQDIASLRDAGYSEDQIFEMTVAAAYGAARLRLDRSLDALTARSPAFPTHVDEAGS
jgi:alkylhydroperoxidase family enzyme